MPPALLLVGFGRTRRLMLPLPLFVLWPLFLLVWSGLGLAWLVTSGRPRPAALETGFVALRAFGALGGTRIDLRGESQESLYLRFL